MIQGTFAEFDVGRLWAAMDANRRQLGFSESEMMEDLNRANNHRVPMALATVKSMVERGETSCQHALHMARWLNKTLECFLTDSARDEPLPFSAKNRLYWSMAAVGDAVAKEKERRGLTWNQVAEELDCSAARAAGIARLKYGMSVHLAMRIAQWLDRLSTEFIRLVK